MPQIKPSNPIIDWGNPITKGLVFDAPLAEGGGGKTKEIITSKEGIFTNTPTWYQKLLGNSLYFNGASSDGPYVDFPTNAQVNSLTKMSLEVWIYRLGNGGGSLERVLSKGSSSTPYWSLSFNNTGGNRIRIFSLWSGTIMEYAFALTDMSDNAWHQIVFTLNDVSASDPSPVVAYLDGIQKTLSLSQNGAGTPPTDSATITLGNSTAATRTVNGYISNSRIWNRILTPTEVKQLYTDPWCIYQKPRFNIINSISSAVSGLRGLISFGMIPFGVATAGITATGGTITDITGYKVHTFTADGTFEITAGTADVEYLVVAGGGGGCAGGGGAGGVKTGTKTSLGVGTYTVTVGAGGNGRACAVGGSPGFNGSDSVFSDITSTGGGGGGSINIDNAQNGGSGGGGGQYYAVTTTPGTGVSGQGYAGGHNGYTTALTDNPYASGGGGGASEAGKNVTTQGVGGNGGAGVASSISGSSVTYGGGGGGSNYLSGTAGSGGAGGGGNGGNQTNGSNGTANTGGGGGAAGGSTSSTGGAGGSGIVIVRYAV